MDEHQKYRCILLFGMPGSGKGTQGAVLDQLPDLVHISMGDIFRKIQRTGKFGREIERFLSARRNKDCYGLATADPERASVASLLRPASAEWPKNGDRTPWRIEPPR